MKLLLATRNRDKVEEIRPILAGLPVELLLLSAFPDVPEVEETGRTLEENAVLKARGVARAAGLAALADDTGLEVDALGGAPGVYSSRYAGEGASYEDNYRLLLERMAGVPAGERTARFRCVAALCLPGGGGEGGEGVAAGERVMAGEGILPGVILEEARGEGGFGYDPVFLVPSCGKTLAEMEPAEKNAMSHRYRALIELKYLMARELGLEIETPGG